MDSHIWISKGGIVLIKLPITQIPTYWELIKTGILRAANIFDSEAPAYCKDLLLRLLSEELQCILMHKNNQIHAVFIIEFRMSNATSKKFMYIHNLYGIKKTSDSMWKDAIQQLIDYAKNEDCYQVCAESKNKRIWEIALNSNFSEGHRKFFYML